MDITEKTIYTDIDAYSKEIGLSPNFLKEAFKIENFYHKLLINEKDAYRREVLYKEFYNKLLMFYGRISHQDSSLDKKIASKDKQVCLFEKELKNKSIIDFGCGEGFFLKNIQKKIAYKKLVGVDIFIPDSLKKNQKIKFISSSIINFETDEKFDIAFSDNVLEHLSPLDYSNHLQSVFKCLKPGGKFILVIPNKLFGPADITRIFDNSSSGKILAMGGHLNESTYTEMNHFLSKAGFNDFQTVIPIPKLKYSFLKNYRIKPNCIIKIEQNKFLLKIFRGLKINGRCKVRFTVTLICQKPYCC
jgi:SAM-dependent methyltransferase